MWDVFLCEKEDHLSGNKEIQSYFFLIFFPVEKGRTDKLAQEQWESELEGRTSWWSSHEGKEIFFAESHKLYLNT